jgi:N4-gp56 family major capsid protein
MARTIVGAGDPKAVKRYSAFLAQDIAKKGYWNKKFMGVGEGAQMPLQVLPQLENDAGDTITYDLPLQLKQRPTEGDDTQAGNEEELKFYTDQVVIDQMRGGVNSGGKMTRKRTIHDLRNLARIKQTDWWARIFDELCFMYCSGARGVNANFIYPTSFSGFAGNALNAPDANHLVYGGAATSKASMTTSDKLTLSTIDKVKTLADVQGGGIEEIPELQPIMIDGEPHFVLVMHPWQEYDLRTNTNAGQWLDIAKAAATAEGRNSPIFKGGLGMYNNVVLHSHKNAIQFSDYGAGSNVNAARALFLGVQAMVCAFGSPGTGLRFDWNEETEDRGNVLVISTSSIFGIKKARFNGKDFGVISVDTAAKAP